MAVDKIRFPQGQLTTPWPQLPAERAKESPLDQYLPAPNWKRQLGIDILAQTRRSKTCPIEFRHTKISFRLLGKNYQWTIHGRTSQVLDPRGNIIGKAHLRTLHPDRQDKLRFFDVTLDSDKKEMFGYIAEDGSVPFSCLTKHTPRDEKLIIARAMECFVSGREMFDGRVSGYLDMVLRRLDDADMLNSLIEHLVPYLDDSRRRTWAAQRLISVSESSRVSNRKRVEITMKILPLAGRIDSVKEAFAQAMARGLSRKFITTMKRFLKLMLDDEDTNQRLAVAYILMHIEIDKSLKLRFFPNISDVLDAVRPVFEGVKWWRARDLAEALYQLSRRGSRNHSLSVLEKLVDLTTILFNSRDVRVRPLAIRTVEWISCSMKIDLPLLRRCFDLLKASLDFKLEDIDVISSLVRIGTHSKADRGLSSDVLRVLLRQVERADPKKKPAILKEIAEMIDSPNTRFGQEVVLDVLKRLEALVDSPDVEVAKQVALAFGSYLERWKLDAEVLRRSAIAVKRLASRHTDDKGMLRVISNNCGLLAKHRDADAEALRVCYRFLAPLACGLSATDADSQLAPAIFYGLGSVVGNVNTNEEVLEDTLKILTVNLVHPNRDVRLNVAEAFYKVRLNDNLDEGELKKISAKLLARLVDERDEDVARKLIYGLEGVCENENADADLLRYILRGALPYIEDTRPQINEQAFQLLRAMAQNNDLPSDMVDSVAMLLMVPLSDKRKRERDRAANSLDFLIDRFPYDVNDRVKKALRIHRTTGRFYQEEALDIKKLRRDLEDADPRIREEAARKARFVFLKPEVLSSDITRLKSLTELWVVRSSLKVSSDDSDYFVKYESRVSLGIITFVIEDKSMPAPERQPMIIVPDISSGEVSLRHRAVRPGYKQKQHHIFRRFAIIPLNNTRRFSDNELKLIYEGLKALPYEVLGGFYSVMADDLDYDRHDPRGLFDQGQVKFQGREVSISTLFHEIGHSVFKSVLTDKQRERFVKLNEASKTDISNYASGYATHDIDEDFAETFTKWTTDSEGFLSKVIDQCLAGKPILLEKMLVVAEALSSGGHFVPTYEVSGSEIDRKQLYITRFNDGKIKTIRGRRMKHEFEYDSRDRLYKMDGERPW
jgi:hypothetical protein